MTEPTGRLLTRREMVMTAAGAGAGLILLSACGGGDGENDASTADATSTAENASSTAENASTALSGSFAFSAWPEGSGVKFFEQRVAAFEQANPQVSVDADFEIPNAEYATVLQSQLAANDLPDLFIFDGNGVPNLIEKNAIAPLSDLIEASGKIDLDWFPRNFLDGLASKDGVVYGLPYYLSPNLLFYRTDMFDEAGVSPPATWDELLATCRTLQDKIRLEYPFAFSPIETFWASDWIFQAGGEIMNADRSEYTLDSPEVVHAMEFLHGLLYKEGVVDPTLPKQTDGVMTQWGEGKIAFWQGSGFQLPTLNTQYPALEGKWAVAALPGDQRRVGVCDGPPLVIAANSEAKEAAFALLETMVTPEAGADLMTSADGQPTANIASYDLPAVRSAFPELGEALKEALEAAVVFPATPTFPQVYYDVFATAYAKFMSDPDGAADIPGAMAQVNDQANELLAQGA